MNAHEIKQLQVRLTKAKAKRDTARAEFEMSREAFKCAQLAVESLETQLKRATTDLIITEHALLRFIERSMDLTLGTIEENISEKFDGGQDAVRFSLFGNRGGHGGVASSWLGSGILFGDRGLPLCGAPAPLP